ncbi:MAG: HAMP domain-containing sensor histidine kinase [Acidimicrobiia bacterium]
MTLRTRLTLAAAVAVAVSVMVVAAVAYGTTRNVLVDEVDDSLRARTDDVNDAVERLEQRAPRRPGFLPPGEFVVPLPRFGGAGGFTQVVTSDGEVFPASDQVGELPVDERAVDVAASGTGAYFSTTSVDGDKLRVYTTPLTEGAALQVARPLDEVDSVLGDLGWVLVLVSVGGVVVAAGIGFAVAKTGLRPVDRLTAVAAEITETRDLSRRIEVDTNDELGRLASSFNAMLSALGDSVGAQRRLVADASHELRTPLTSLRTNVAVLSHESELDEHDAQRLRSDIDTQIAELSDLVGNVIELARGAEPTQRSEPIRLDELVEEAVDQAAFHWPDVDYHFVGEPATVVGDTGTVTRAVTNLLDNAGKWSPDGGAVDVVVRHADGTAEVAVSDHGPGVPAPDREHVFERFWRSPEARDKPGSGLGLAIVAQAAASHGGSVAVEDAPGGGARFLLRFPASS